MEIRANSKHHRKLIRIKTPRKDVQITLDNDAEIPVAMVKTDDGSLSEWMRGFIPIKNFLRYGFNRIRRNCPLRHRKCLCEKCSWYFIDNDTGDCVKIWSMFRRPT